MNIPTQSSESEDIFADLTERFEAISTASDDLQEQVALYCELIEEITGRGIGPDGRETHAQENHLAYADEASDLLGRISSALKPLLQELKASKGVDGTTLAMMDAYKHIADDFIIPSADTLKFPETVRSAPATQYELDVGEAMNGSAFEDKLLYAKDHKVWRPTMEQIDHMNRLEPDMAYAEAMVKNPYKDRPWDPRSVWLADMHAIISHEMGLDAHPIVIADQCVIPVPCIGLSADIFYGVDCFIVFRDPVNGHESVVTIDISLDPVRKLIDGFKADILYTPHGAYVHEDLPIHCDFIEPGSRKIDTPRVNDRRKQVGKAMAEVIRYRAQHHLELFRLPKQKRQGVSSSQHRANMRNVLNRRA